MGKGNMGKGSMSNSAGRERLTPKRITGKLVEWKGTYGWIRPTERIQHPAAARKAGKVFLSQEDVEMELTGVGGLVSFFLYVDDSGLGAMHVRPAASPVVGKTPGKFVVQKPAMQKTQQHKLVQKMKPAAKVATAKPPPKEPKEQLGPDKTKREVVLASPVTGVVKRGFGKVYFITPDEPVDHPDIDKHNGDIYLHADDLEGDAPLCDAKVVFFIYSDEHGLGAEHCTIMEQGSGELKKGSRDRKEGRRGRRGSLKGEPRVQKTSSPKGVVQSMGKASVKANGKAQSKGQSKKGADPTGPKGPDLPRERVSLVPVTGEVAYWHPRKFGWIKATEEVDHPDKAKHGGKIYVSPKDVIEPADMEKGKTVQFHVFSDASGLGAEEVLVL